MAIVNLRDSLDHALSEMFEFWRYDAWIIVDDQIPIERLINEAETVPGVTNAEGWGFTVARYVRPDDTESDNLYLIAPPAGTPLLDPPVIAGRRLRPGDTVPGGEDRPPIAGGDKPGAGPQDPGETVTCHRILHGPGETVR